MLLVEFCPSNRCQTPNLQYLCMCSGLEIVLADDQVKMRLLGWALIHYGWFSYKKREI